MNYDHLEIQGTWELIANMSKLDGNKDDLTEEVTVKLRIKGEELAGKEELILLLGRKNVKAPHSGSEQNPEMAEAWLWRYEEWGG